MVSTKAVIAGRYGLYGIIAIETLVVPYLLEDNFYGLVEYYRNLVLLFQFLFVGLCTGYINIKYKFDRDMIGEFVGSAGGIILLGAAGSLIFFKSWLLAIAVTFVMLALVLETLLKSQAKYTRAIMFKPLYSLSYVLISYFLYSGLIRSTDNLNEIAIVCLSALLAILIWGPVCLPVLRQLSISIRFSLRGALELIRNGILVNLATFVLALHLFGDRHIIKELFPDILPDYSFAMNTSQFVILAITTLTYINQVEMGKAYLKAGRRGLRECLGITLKRVLIIYVALNMIFAPMVLGFENFIPFDHFARYALLTVFLYGIAHVLFSVNIALVYLNKFAVIPVMLSLSLIANILFDLNVANFGLNSIWILVSSYLSFIIIGLISLAVVRRALNNEH